MPPYEIEYGGIEGIGSANIAGMAGIDPDRLKARNICLAITPVRDETFFLFAGHEQRRHFRIMHYFRHRCGGRGDLKQFGNAGGVKQFRIGQQFLLRAGRKVLA